MLDMIFGFIFGVGVGIIATLTLQAYEKEKKYKRKMAMNDNAWNEFCDFQDKFWNLLNENNYDVNNQYIREYLRGLSEPIKDEK